jgi:hypothetical protein
MLHQEKSGNPAIISLLYIALSFLSCGRLGQRCEIYFVEKLT